MSGMNLEALHHVPVIFLCALLSSDIGELPTFKSKVYQFGCGLVVALLIFYSFFHGLDVHCETAWHQSPIIIDRNCHYSTVEL